MRGEDPVCSYCGYPIHTNEHSPECTMCKEGEMNKKTKERIVQLWNEVVLGIPSKPTDQIETMTRDELRSFLSEQLTLQIELLMAEWGIKIDETLMVDIQKETDPDKKAQLEVMYIQHMHKQVDSLVRTFDHSAPKSTKWNSWPDRIKKTKEFNCVGAILLGSVLLEKAGIQQFTGNPPNHVVNIARLSNGDWWFIDFMNGETQVKKIDPQQREIQGHQVLMISHPDIDYRLVPITSKDEVDSYVLGNLASLQKKAYDMSLMDSISDNIEVQEAVVYAKEKGLLEMGDISEYQYALYPVEMHINETNEMKLEIQRIGDLYERDGLAQEALQGLSREQIIHLMKEVVDNEDEIRRYLYEDDESIMKHASPELKHLLTLYQKRLHGLRMSNREEYGQSIERFLQKNHENR